MREKLAEYASEGASWPHSAAILDPIRLTIVVSGPAHIVQVARWFTDPTSLPESPVSSSSAVQLEGTSMLKCSGGSNCPDKAESSHGLDTVHCRQDDESSGSASFRQGPPKTAMDMGLPVLRVKNKFAFASEELKGGYRDLMLSVLYEEPELGLRIIGEIQVPQGSIDSSSYFPSCLGGR